jgi:hypothetical protein
VSVRSLRVLADSLPSIVVAGSAGILTLVVWQVGQVVRTSKRAHVLEEVIVAATAAEEAAFEAARQDLEAGSIFQIQSSTGMLCSVSLSATDKPAVEEPSADDSGQLLIEVRGRNQRYYSYRCDLLAGAAPTGLGYPLSMRKSVLDSRVDLRRWIEAQPDLPLTLLTERDLPRLVEAPESMSPTIRWAGLRRDDTIALLRTPFGTDLQDHVFDANEDGVCHPRIPPSGTIRLPGHLWLDRGPKPLVIELSRALTVVAHGNIYIGRSLFVSGPGKLTLVALRGDSELFADRDANGRWSRGDTLLTGTSYRGPMEGTGAIYLGLPGQDADPNHPQDPVQLTIAASLCAQGEVHVLATRAEIRGALVMEQGLTRFGTPTLVLPGKRLPNTQRERVPGFRSVGGRRPGLLTFHE